MACGRRVAHPIKLWGPMGHGLRPAPVAMACGRPKLHRQVVGTNGTWPAASPGGHGLRPAPVDWLGAHHKRRLVPCRAEPERPGLLAPPRWLLAILQRDLRPASKEIVAHATSTNDGLRPSGTFASPAGDAYRLGSVALYTFA